MGTSQTGTATLGLAQRETRRLVQYQENTLVKPKKALNASIDLKDADPKYGELYPAST